MNYREIAERIRKEIGPKIDISSKIKAVDADLEKRYRGADEQEAFIVGLFKKHWDPSCFVLPENSKENGFCGDILIKNKGGKIALGIDVKFPSNESRNTSFFSPPDLASILFLNDQSPPVSQSRNPAHKLIMTFSPSGEYKFLDPKEVLSALLAKKAELMASKHRGPGNYPAFFLEEVKSYSGKIEVKNGGGEIWPQDFLYYSSQNKLMF